MTPIFRLTIACLAALAAPCAGAAVYCVDTGLELETAIEAAAVNGADDEIRIAAGVIKGTSEPAGNPRWKYLPGESDENTRLDISGGWSPAASCTAQTQKPDLTQLDAEFKGPALRLYPSVDIYSGQITLRNLLVTRGYSNHNEGAAVFYSAKGAASRFRMERTVSPGNWMSRAPCSKRQGATPPRRPTTPRCSTSSAAISRSPRVIGPRRRLH